METVLDGRVTADLDMSHAVDSILRLGYFQCSILEIASTDQSTKGAIALSEGKFVIGACMDCSDVGGYEAVRRLLMLSNAYYSYKAANRATLGRLDQSLKIPLHELRSMLPSMPLSLPDNKTPPRPPTYWRMEDVKTIKDTKLARQYNEGVARMRDWEARSMRWRGIILWSFFGVMVAGIWLTYGSEISSLLSTSHFSLGVQAPR